MGVFTVLDMIRSADEELTLLGTRSGGMSAKELHRAALGGATILRESCARSVVFIGGHGAEFVISMFAAAAAGLPFTPMNYRLSAGQLRELIGQLDEPVVLLDHSSSHVVEGSGFRTLPSEDWVAKAAAAPAWSADAARDDDPAVVLFTSGTTSTPKRAVLRHNNLLSYVIQTVEFASADPDDAFLVTVPPYHVAGVGTVLTNIFAGRRIVVLPNFSAAAWLDLARRERITNAMVVPTMLARIVEELAGRPAEVSTLRSIAYGGARTPLPVLEGALRAFGEIDFVNAYGLTETSSTIALLGPQDHRSALTSSDPAVRARLGSAGQVVPSVEAQVRGPEGEILVPGDVGELWVRGSQISGEYVGSGSGVDDEGWFDTRDSAYFDDGGYLFIVGRTDDTIIKGGENIAPAEIEDVLARHPGIKDAAVVGQPDELWGARIVAVVVARDDAGLTDETVKSWVREHLRGSRTPDEVHFRQELPYTPTGKLLRRQLLTLGDR